MTGKKEQVKTALIMLLGISALVLGYFAGLFGVPIVAGGFGSAHVTLSLAQSQEAILIHPSAILVNSGDQFHRAYRANMAEEEEAGLFALYTQLVPYFARGLASVTRTVAIAPYEWQEALSSPGVFFSFDTSFPASVLLRSFGHLEGHSPLGQIQALYLTAQDDFFVLYYLDEQGLPHRATTNVELVDFFTTLSLISPNGASWGHERASATPLPPHTILLGHSAGFPEVLQSSAQTALFGQLEAFIVQFGMHPNLVRYIDEGDSRTMVEEGARLRLLETGKIYYSYVGPAPRLRVQGDTTPSLNQAIEAAYALSQVLHLVSGEASIHLSGFSYQNQQFIIEFSYYVGGMRVFTQYPAAQVVISGPYVTSATLFAQHFSYTGQTLSIMPCLQAQLAAGLAPIALIYQGDNYSVDQLSPIYLRPRWVHLREV